MTMPLLDVQGLKTYFLTSVGVVKAVDDVTFQVECGESVGLLGESGCGKSVTALSIMRLVPDPPGKIMGGRILLMDRNLLDLSDYKMRMIRGEEIALVPQDPHTYLNPIMTVGDQIAEAIMLHQGIGKGEAFEKGVEMIKITGIASPEKVAKAYAHQLSGGMKQRILIAMALSCNPSLLIADEITTALDVTVQAQILELIMDLQKKFNMSMLMITHDVAVVAEVCKKVIVMYAGKIVEMGDVVSVFKNPTHPYTGGLLKSVPSITERKKRLQPFEGTVPDLVNMPPGCPLRPRCCWATEECARKFPAIKEVEPGHFVACYHPLFNAEEEK